MGPMRPYLTHGILELDNNIAERGMRAIALGPKNYPDTRNNPTRQRGRTRMRVGR